MIFTRLSHIGPSPSPLPGTAGPSTDLQGQILTPGHGQTGEWSLIQENIPNSVTRQYFLFVFTEIESEEMLG